MPLFAISTQRLSVMPQTNFKVEKTLQELIEKNLQTVFNCRFIASEYSTGAQHAGRIDTLALSEDDNPVIIEYKKVESSELINQSLYYLSWIHDHRGDFEIAVQKALGNSIKVDWSDVRVICIAPNYKKYDLYAVEVMGAKIELWTYRLFKNQFLYLEEILRKSYSPASDTPAKDKSAVILTAGKKAALTRATGSYTVEQHFEGRSEKIKELASAVQEFVMGLDPAMAEVPKKHYIAYKISQNIVCMEFQAQSVIIFLKLDPSKIGTLPKMASDVTGKGHHGTGDLRMALKSLDDLDVAKSYIERAYQEVGG